MVILDEKSVPPPPPPYASTLPAPPPFRASYHRGGLGTLPNHILLQIVYRTFPHVPSSVEGTPERHRKNLYWLSVGLRLVNRSFYIACMHVLRSTYLSCYQSLIRAPYTTDPFPQVEAWSLPAVASPLQTVQRETQVLDLFIALKVREDVWLDDSDLHLGREESFKDLFDFNQPKSRLEDLIRVYGVREGVVTVYSSPSSPSSSARKNRPSPIPFSALSISFRPTRVGLVLTSSRQKRTIVDIPRKRFEALEAVAKKLVDELVLYLYRSAT